jgi:hypothetical protein
MDELIDVGKKQVSLEKRQAKNWLGKMAKIFPNVVQELLAVDGLVAPIVSMRAKVADFTVLPSITAKEEAFWALARDAALFHSGRAVLVVPEGWNGTIGETVVVAWKDSVEAVRSLAAARPFLIDAKEVRLLSITETENDDQTAPAMVDYLTRAGFHVEFERFFFGLPSGSCVARGNYNFWYASRNGRLRPFAIARMGVWRCDRVRVAQHFRAGFLNALAVIRETDFRLGWGAN